MKRTKPAETKLVICVWHPFTWWRPQPVLAETIRKRWPEMNVVHLPDYDKLPEELPDTDIFVGYSLRAKQLKDARKLKWIHSTAAGVAQLMYPELRDAGILVTNPSGVFSVPMAEHTMGLILAMARNFPDSVRQQDKAIWSQQELWDKPQHLAEVNGQVLLIVGYGSIGRALAKRAKAFDMRVRGVTRSGQGDGAHVERILPAAQLHEALAEADYVVVSAPETAETKHLIGAAELAKVKRGASSPLAPVKAATPSASPVAGSREKARSPLLDEAALICALKTGALGGAAIDVAETEPLPADSPLWKAPNLFITPHTSALSDRLWVRQAAILVELLERWFDGEEMFNQVDVTRGY